MRIQRPGDDMSWCKPGALADPAVRAEVVKRLARTAQTNRQRAWDRAKREGWAHKGRVDGRGYELQVIRDGRLFVYVTLNVNAAISTAVTPIRNTPLYLLNGTGETVGLWDEEAVRATHREFGGRATIVDNVTLGDHATHVAGTIGAAGVTPSALGMAPMCRIDSYDWDDDASEMASRAMASGGETNAIQVSNHSYGVLAGWAWGDWSGTLRWHWWGTWGARESDNFGQYDSDTRDWDAICYAAPRYLPFKAAGNDRADTAPSSGTVFAYYDNGWKTKAYDPNTDPRDDGWPDGSDTVILVGSAKNIITVGAVNDAVLAGQRSLDKATMTLYSGWGPVDDGRVKPDIVADGSALYSCSSLGDSAYATKSGTSMACANATGSAALLAEYYAKLFPGHAILSSTLKGLILHTADDIGFAGPDYRHGWGLMNDKAAADVLRIHRDFPHARKIVEGVLPDAVQAQTLSIRWDGSNPIRLTLCWTDPPGESRTGLDNPAPALVNDLDLRLVDPSGVTNCPFVLDPRNPSVAATTGDNHLDNVEQIVLRAPNLSGAYTIMVRHDRPLVDGEQAYSLLVDGAAAPPEIRHTSLPNTGQTGGVYSIEADITAIDPLQTNSLWVFWTTNGPAGDFSSNRLVRVVGDRYAGSIPGQRIGTTVRYFLHAGTEKGMESFDPPDAPDAIYAFDVARLVTLTVLGSPDAHGTVSPPYGDHEIASGVVVRASASPVTPVENRHRFVNRGWIGTANVPPEGASNTVAFTIGRSSALIWRWESQYSLAQTSTVPGFVNATSWWKEASFGSTVRAADKATADGQTFCFVEWMLDGVRQPDATGVAVNPVVGIAMTSPHTAGAVYLPEDLDSDGDQLPDWWERHYFGSLAPGRDDDPDGDGYRNIEEYQDRSNPRDARSEPAGPVIRHTPLADPQASPAPWTILATVTDNHAVADVLLRWRRVGLGWRQAPMEEAEPGRYVGAIPPPGILGDTYEYEIEAADAAGYVTVSDAQRFFVAYPVHGLSGTNLSFVLRAGTATNVTLSVTNAGNAALAWKARILAVGMRDDMESGTNGWRHEGAQDLWHPSTNRWHSPGHAWYCGDETRQYHDYTHAKLVTPAVRLGNHARLTFWHWIDSEILTPIVAWDGGIVEISTDGGSTFSQITPEGGYPFTIYGHSASPWPNATPCYAGTGGWNRAVFDLSAYAGKDAQIRFHMGSDGVTVGEGWYIDDVEIAPRTVAGAWFTAVPTNGVLPSARSTSLNLRVDSAGLPSGIDDVLRLSFESNDPLKPTDAVEAALGVRSPPEARIVSAGQSGTNGAGVVAIRQELFDADGDICQVELLCSTNRGGHWSPAWITGATARFGSPSVSNASPPQIRGVATQVAGAPATNLLAELWSTTHAPDPIRLAANTLIRSRAWDGRYWSLPVTSQPFVVDNEPPSPPVSLAVTSHVARAWSSRPTLAATWLPASDGSGVGIAGYACLVTNRTDAAPAAPLPISTHLDAARPVGADGTNWWVNVFAVDAVGNRSEPARDGPFWVDTTPPSSTGATVTIPTSLYGPYVVGRAVPCVWRGFADGGSGIVRYFLGLADHGGTTNGQVATGGSGSVAGAAPNATNTVYVWAQDGAGLIGGAASAAALVLDPDGDFDRDGLSSASEEICGTSADDRQSVLAFRATDAAPSNGGPANPCMVVIRWDSAANRYYTLHRKSLLAGGPIGWAQIPSFAHVPGTGGMMSFTDVVSRAQTRFYKLTVRTSP